MGILKGKKGIVMGVANNHSIAWGIAQKLAEQGAELCFTYQGESLLRRIEPLAQSIDNNFILECDVLNNESIKNKLGYLFSFEVERIELVEAPKDLAASTNSRFLFFKNSALI